MARHHTTPSLLPLCVSLGLSTLRRDFLLNFPFFLTFETPCANRSFLFAIYIPLSGTFWLYRELNPNGADSQTISQPPSDRWVFLVDSVFFSSPTPFPQVPRFCFFFVRFVYLFPPKKGPGAFLFFSTPQTPTFDWTPSSRAEF